jgi:hypothetical protein
VQANFGKNRRSFEGTKATSKNKAVHQKQRKISIGNKGKLVPRKAVKKWTNCCEAVGKWTSAELEQWLDQGTINIKSTRKWENLIHLGLYFL